MAITVWCPSISYYNTTPVLDYWQSLSGVYPAPITMLLPVLDYCQSLSGVYPAPTTPE
jgi:microcystin-dependent protein